MQINTGIPNALVVAIRRDKRFGAYTYTDERGVAKLKLPPGEYDIFVFKEGYYLHAQTNLIYTNIIKYVDLKEYVIEKVVYVWAYPEYAYYYPYQMLTSAYYALYYHPEYFQKHASFLLRVLQCQLAEGKFGMSGVVYPARSYRIIDYTFPFSTVRAIYGASLYYGVFYDPPFSWVRYLSNAQWYVQIIYLG